MNSNIGMYGQAFSLQVINRIGCNACSLHCNSVPRNMYYTVMGNIRPAYYFYQIPDSIVKTNTSGYLSADTAKMQDNFVHYWSQNIKNPEAKNNASSEFEKIFKELLDTASKETEKTNPQISIFFDAVGYIMADDFAEALKKAYSIYKKYSNLVNANSKGGLCSK